MPSFRLKRVESLLQEEISSLILMNTIKDPRVSNLLCITRVTVSKDLCYAKVLVSSVQEKRDLEESVAALNHAAGFIQGTIGKKLRMHATPKLSFHIDTALQKGFDITQQLKDLVG